jgi:hypothetical protein
VPGPGRYRAAGPFSCPSHRNGSVSRWMVVRHPRTLLATPIAEPHWAGPIPNTETVGGAPPMIRARHVRLFMRIWDNARDTRDRSVTTRFAVVAYFTSRCAGRGPGVCGEFVASWRSSPQTDGVQVVDEDRLDPLTQRLRGVVLGVEVAARRENRCKALWSTQASSSRALATRLLRSAPTAIGPSPFNPRVFYGSTNPNLSSYYSFAAEIESSQSTALALQFTAPFTLDPTTYVDGCPPAGQLVSTDFGG